MEFKSNPDLDLHIFDHAGFKKKITFKGMDIEVLVKIAESDT